MATKENLLKDLDRVTEKISAQVWTLNLGTLGTTWSLLITTSVPEKLRFSLTDSRWIFLICFCALLCEMGQYLSAYKMQTGILRDIETKGQTEFSYDTDSWGYRLRTTFFFLKIVLTILAAIALLLTIFVKLR